jgi:hypothetical protein
MFANQPILKIISVFSGVRVTRYVVLCVCFVDRCLYFLLWPLCCLYTDFYYLFGIFKLVLITAMKSLVDIQLLEPLILLHHSIEYIYLQNFHLAIADSTHLLWIKIYEKLGNICEELSPLIYRWRFSSSGPISLIMISQHAITVSATVIYQWSLCLIFHISTL